MAGKIKYLLRINEDLKLYIARQARLNDRSLNQEINFRLRLSKRFDELYSSIKAVKEHGKDAAPQDTTHEIIKLLSNYNEPEINPAESDVA